jgi:hypothetical protein
MRMIPARNQLVSQIHLSCYLPKKLRGQIFEVLHLALNKGRSPKEENLDENWKKFCEEIKKLQDSLDDLVSK